MEEWTPQGLSQEGEGADGSRPGSISVRPRILRTIASLRSSPFAAAFAALVFAVVLVSALTYYGARRFTGHAADVRASNEAASFAQHSGKLATGDAFDGYIQILRDAEDPVVASRGASNPDRIAAMQRLLYLNTNRFASLTISDRAGIVLATTDSSIQSEKDSQVFSETRANLSPANSDIVLPDVGARGYVEYSAPLHEPNGAVWAILIARGDPARLFRSALAAAVDGGRNVIINSRGQFAAGVPEPLLGEPWRGSAVGEGGVRASIDGVDSICGLAPIGKDTQIDRGLNVASCLPASLIQVEHAGSMNKQGLITIAGAVLALVLAGGLLRLSSRQRPDAPGSVQHSEVEPAVSGDADSPDQTPYPTPAPTELRLEHLDPVEDVKPPASADPPVSTQPAPIVVQPDVDAAALITAYEARNERLAARLRESVQARLLIATTRAGEAFRLATAPAAEQIEEQDETPVPDTAERARWMHDDAMAQLEIIRDRELRIVGQELHPGLVRLGLAGALRSLQKELADELDLELQIDPAADSVVGVSGREELSSPLRLVLYRFVLEASRAAVSAESRACTLIVERDDRLLTLTITGAPGQPVNPETLAAATIALEAYGGRVSIEQDDAGTRISAVVPGQEPIADDAVAQDDGSDPSAAISAPSSEHALEDPRDDEAAASAAASDAA